MVVPAATNIRILLTADDVIHAWTVPAFGIKFDTVPGRLAETWINVPTPGVYYGQCSELCGAAHSKMPIAVEVVARPAFEAWPRGGRREIRGSAGAPRARGRSELDRRALGAPAREG